MGHYAMYLGQERILYSIASLINFSSRYKALGKLYRLNKKCLLDFQTDIIVVLDFKEAACHFSLYYYNHNNVVGITQ